jgi:hypothetical protein
MTDTLPPPDEREAFEAWLQREYPLSWARMTAHETGLMWDSWQARAALPAAQPACRAEQKGPQQWVCDCAEPRADCKPALMAEAERLVNAVSDAITITECNRGRAALADGGANGRAERTEVLWINDACMEALERSRGGLFAEAA